MKTIILCLVLLPLTTLCQKSTDEIRFVNGTSWEEVKAQSAKENKYIFIDAFATWCAPCKRMDREVFSNDTVSNYINDHFIPVKMQIDTSTKDTEGVKNWYPDAHRLKELYKVEEIPCYLFFAPGGKLVYRIIGYKTIPEFLDLSKIAMNRENLLYYMALEDYKNGKKDTSNLHDLAIYAQSLGDANLAKNIASDYISITDKIDLLNRNKILYVLDVARNRKLADSLASIYKKDSLDKVPEKRLYNYNEVRFMDRFLNLYSSGSTLFRYSYESPATMDSIFQFKGWAKRVVTVILTREELSDKLIKDNKPLMERPDWNEFISLVMKKYPAVDANSLVLDYQLRYYKSLKDWRHYTSSLINRVEKFGAFGPISSLDFNLNNLAWEIFQYSDDKKQLVKALSWSDSAVNLSKNANKANWMDTNANILYKLGRKKKAIAVQEQAILLDPNDQNLKEHLSKMKKGEPTW